MEKQELPRGPIHTVKRTAAALEGAMVAVGAHLFSPRDEHRSDGATPVGYDEQGRPVYAPLSTGISSYWP